MKKIFGIVFLFLLLSVFVLYMGVVFLLPQVINSDAAIKKLETFILHKSGMNTNIEGLELKVSPKLNFILNIDSVNSKSNNVSVFNLEKFSLSYKLPQNRLISINADNIYIDGQVLKQLQENSHKKHETKFNLGKCPEIHINKVTYKSDLISAYAKNIEAEKGIIRLEADVQTQHLKEMIKLGYSGSLQIEENNLKANQFEIKLGNSHLYANGYLINKDKTFDFILKGEKLPVAEIMPIILHLQKSQDPTKKFIENFKNFKGIVNVNLKFNKEGIWGTCIANNLGANAVWFDIPLYFREAVFNFRGQKIDSIAEGILGKEKVIHTLNMTDLLTPQRKAVGTMKTTITKKFDYVPNLTVLNTVNISLVYKIKDKKPDVYYNIDIPQNSDLVYNSFYLGLRDYQRKIYGNTFKDNNNLYIKKYKYSYSDSGKENVILFGDGLFLKNIDKIDPDKFVLQYITCHTNGYAPISVTGSFGEKVRGGEFKGDLKYDFKNNQVLGTFDIVKARHQKFHIENAHIVSQNGIFNVTSNGFFNGEKYSAELNLKNNIYGETLIYDMKLFLDKLIFETKPNAANKPKMKLSPEDLTKKVQNTDITVNNLEILINEIKRENFILKNVKLIGGLKNNIFDFKMSDLNFADGIINAGGIYNFAQNTSQISFEAKNINSNKAAEMTLNLKDQIEGIANAKVDISAKEMFRFLDAHCMFEVKEGFLPKLGDKEFMMKNSKYKLSQITNFDLTQKDLMKDDIKGTFDVHNAEIKNINLTTWHALSAVFLEGNYDMEKQYADLQMFWHYSKEAPKGIRIFGVPLRLILKVVFRPEKTKELYRSKLSQIPKIDADEKHSRYYRIHLSGDINNNKTNLELKEIR
ncbi:hypothetical protein IJ596_08735 [bacterium]|nr:hypothetical protein [bacterium]